MKLISLVKLSDWLMIIFSHQGLFCCTPRGRRRRGFWSGRGSGSWPVMTMSGSWPRAWSGRAGTGWRPPSISSPWGCSVSWSGLIFCNRDHVKSQSEWQWPAPVRLNSVWCHGQGAMSCPKSSALQLYIQGLQKREVLVLTRFYCCWIFADHGIRPNYTLHYSAETSAETLDQTEFKVIAMQFWCV